MDAYRYFRIEARELIDELAAGLADLGRGEPTSETVGRLLRHAHTLKGAARVVAQPDIADHTHALEGLLEPFRGAGDPVPADRLEEMLGQVDEIGDLLRAIAAPAASPAAPAASPAGSAASPAAGSAAGPATGSAVGPVTRPVALPATDPPMAALSLAPEATTPALVPSPRTEAAVAVRADPARTARASLAEIDAVIDGVGRSRAHLGRLRDCLVRAAALSERIGITDDVRDEFDRLRRDLGAGADRMERDLREVHDVAERLRLVPVTSIVSDLEGAARDVASVQGKRVHVDVSGAQLRLDAPVLSAVQGALRQIVRNAVAHGIEAPADRLAAGKSASGRIRLEVSQSAGQVVFSCSDDGRGVDLDAVRRELGRGHPERGPLDDQQVLDLLVLGGVSTATTLSEISGRGIGLDVVRDAATQLGGRVAIRTRQGEGTTIDLSTPLSLSAQEVLLMEDAGVSAVRLAAVLQTARVSADDITAGLGGETLRHGGRQLPFLPLATAFGDDSSSGRSRSAWSVLILSSRQGPVAIGVRRLIGTATLAIRPLPPLAPVAPVVSGVWLDIDAQPRLVLDPERLSELALTRRAVTVAAPAPAAPILIVDDSLTTRMLEQSVLESAGYRVELASSAEEGLDLAARTAYALALVDVEMPGMNGFEFIEQTRARPELRYLPCILVTSRASAADRERGRQCGAQAHLDKREFHQGTLLDRISEVLEG
jgi:two-component system chemotaxis sensor kinase CheA